VATRGPAEKEATLSDFRRSATELLHLLASASAQLAYEREVPHAYVPDELISLFADDFFTLKAPGFVEAFTDEELADLAELYGLVRAAARVLATASPENVSELQAQPEWRGVMLCAKRLLGSSFRQ